MRIGNPEYISESLERALFLEQFLQHSNMKKKKVKKMRKLIKEEIKHIKHGEYDKCVSLTEEMKEEYS